MKLEDVKVLTQQALAQSMGTDYMDQHGYLEGIPAENSLISGVILTNSGQPKNLQRQLFL